MQQEKKYGKCPECSAPCEVVSKTDFDGLTPTVQYDEYVFHPQHPGTAIWVKASERMPVTSNPPKLFIIKWDSISGNHFLRYMTANQFEDIRKVSVLEYFWLDESGQSNKDDAVDKKLLEFIRDCAENWDCDPDSHTYNLPCRKCEATKLYEQYNQQKEGKP